LHESVIALTHALRDLIPEFTSQVIGVVTMCAIRLNHHGLFATMPNMMNSSSVKRRRSRPKHSKCGNPPAWRQPFRTAAEAVSFNPQGAQFRAKF
jgi:hypothetical protein